MNKHILGISALLCLAALSLLSAQSDGHLDRATGAYVQDSTQQYVGQWERDGPNDARAKQHITLQLRADGTYTKTLDANVDGHSYGGTHSGTWKASGSTVYLSGDGNWPAISHDLREFQKVD